MKSKSPFGKNTPLKKIEIFQGSTSTYRHPSTVIQPIVGAEVGKKLAEVGSKIAVDAIKAKSDKKPEFKVPEFEKPKIELGEYEGDLRTLGGFEERKIPGKKSIMTLSEMTPEQKSWRDQKIKELGKEGYAKLVNKNKSKDITQKRTYTLVNGKKVYDSWQMEKNNSLAINMKGSPAKQVNPYAAVNPEAVPASQSQNVLGAQPIVGADINQARNVDMQAMIDPYKSPGATFKPGEKINAENIYGQAGQRQALMNLGSPMHAHTPTHGKKYKKGDLIDESDFETLGTGYNVQNISDIQEDKKGQFMTTLGDSEQKAPPIKSRPKSRIIDYPDPKGSVRDTIRPQVGKFFKKTY